MMYDREKSDLAIVAVKPTNKAGQPAAELVEPRAGAAGNASQQSTGRAQYRGTVSQALKRMREYHDAPLHTRGGRSYGADGGGCGTFIVHTNRWRLPPWPKSMISAEA
jgi:hypothetical protein